MRAFRLSTYFRDTDCNYEYPSLQEFDYKQLADEEEWDQIVTNIIEQLNAARAEVIDECEGEQYGSDEADSPDESN